MSQYYRIKKISPKIGEMSDTHRSMLGQRCYWIVLERGYPALIKVKVNPEMHEFHTICTTKVVDFLENDTDLIIETERTLYALEQI